jgi:hypothetical protein
MNEDDVNLGQMLDLATPWCLRAAATLRSPEHIAAGHRDIGELAAVTHFTELARRAGLEVAAAGSQSSGRLVVECRPAG